MAHTLGLGEDVELDQCYRAAADELYSAPCHLATAQSLVAEYRGRVEAAREGVGP